MAYISSSLDEAPPAEDEDERVLMPRSSPRPDLRPRHRHRGGPTRYGSNSSEHEYSALAGQLHALELDIDDAREASRYARRMPGLTFRSQHKEAAPLPRGESVVLADG